MLRLGEHRRVRERDELVGISPVIDPAICREQSVLRHLELLGGGRDEQRAQLQRSVLHRVACHERHAARVAPEIDRRERRIARDDVDVARKYSQGLRRDRGEHVVGALTDLRRTAHDRHAAAAIDADLRSGVGHLVPVDRQPGTGDVGAAGESQALSPTERAAALRESGCPLQRVEALAKPHRRDAKLVDGAAVGGLQDRLAVLKGVETEVLGDLVELALESVTRLRRSVAALRTAWRLVRVHADAIELVRRDAVGHGEQGAGVIRRRDAVRRVRAAVEPALVMHRRDRAVLLHTGADAHLHRVAAAVGVEHLLAIERDLHRAPSTDREERGRELVAEGIALPAKGATVRCRDDADA